MKCKLCNSNSKVLNHNYKKNMTVRYRKCMNKKCGEKFTTKETYEDSKNYKRLYDNLVSKMKRLLNGQ